MESLRTALRAPALRACPHPFHTLGLRLETAPRSPHAPQLTIISSFLIGFVGPGGVRLRLPALISENPYWSGLTERSGHNLFLFYADESGNRDCNLQKIRPDGSVLALDHIYVLTAVSLFNSKWQGFERAINYKKREWIDNLVRRGLPRLELSDCEIKSNWIRNPKERARHPLLKHLSDAAMLELVDLFFAQIPANNINVFSVVVDKRHLHGYMDEGKLHRKAWELLLERVEDFLALEHSRHNGIMVVDDVSKEMNRSLAMKHAYFQQSGTSSGRKLRHIIEMPLFVRSELSNGIQLADLVSYNIYRAFKTGDLAYPWFRRIAPFLWAGSSATSGLPTGLKIFPPESPLWAQARSDLGSPWLALK